MPEGSPGLRAAFATMLKATCMKGVTFDSSNVALGAGLLGLLDLVIFILADEDDWAILPAPHYSMFEGLHKARNHVRTARWYPEASHPVAAQLDAVKREAESQGGRVRTLLLTNPDNPTGEMMDGDTCWQVLLWCATNKVHLISDELYSNSLFDRSHDYVSMARMAQERVAELPGGQEALALVHVLNGTSKDWALAGFRAAAMVTWNQGLLAAYSQLALPQQISGQTQHTLTEVFNDVDFVHSFLERSGRMVEASYRRIEGVLDELGVEHSKCQGAVFVWMNLRPWLPELSWDGEKQLVNQLCDKYKIVVNNGQSLFGKEPGWFRICYACICTEQVDELCVRLRRALTEIKKSNGQ